MARHQPHLLVDLPDGVASLPVDPETRHHLEKALRIESSPVTYTDGMGLLGSGTYEEGMLLRGEERHVSRSGRVTVAVSPPHSNSRARFLVEKLAELGVWRLIWLQTAHGQGRAPKSKKTDAWVRSALEQSRGMWLMDVIGPLGVSDAMEMGTAVFADAGGDDLAAIPAVEDPVLFIGPEGGFAPDEIPAGAIRMRLGDTILRVETAAIAGAVLLREHPTG